jgi:hypothetical protein
LRLGERRDGFHRYQYDALSLLSQVCYYNSLASIIREMCLTNLG